MKRARHKLSASAVKAFIDSAKQPPNLGRTGGWAMAAACFLIRTKYGTVSWTFLYQRAGRRHEVGLGSALDVSLSLARELAQESRALLAQQKDPLEEKHKHAARAPVSFKVVAEDYAAAFGPRLKNGRQRQQLDRTIARDCLPIHATPISTLASTDVVSVLKQPHLADHPTTRAIALQTIKRIVDSAAAQGLRDPNLRNPATADLIGKILPLDYTGSHHPALPFDRAPVFFQTLLCSAGLSLSALSHSPHPLTSPLLSRTTLRSQPARLALCLIMLTGVRKLEMLGAEWPEFDLDRPDPLWTVPACRMKLKKPHLVPLSQPATAILRFLHARHAHNNNSTGPASPYIFGRRLSPNSLEHLTKPQNVTVHGMRSCLRDWLGSRTDISFETCEEILSHTAGDAVVAAYRREPAIDKRRQALELWAAYLSATPVA